MFLINGHNQRYLLASDRAIQFGDGSFTTARVINSHICLQSAHLLRLRKACERLFIPFTHWDTLQTEMCTLARSIKFGIIKVIISRGNNGKGYNSDGCFRPNRILSIASYPQYYNKWKNSGIKLSLSPVRLGRNPMLAGIKHLNRLEQVLIHIYLKRSNADEALVLDSEGKIIECCSANLFWRLGDKVFTPIIDQAGVDGVMRKFCLTKLINSPFHVFEVRADLQMLRNADEVLICNALLPVAPVHSFEKKIWTSRKLYHFLAPLCERN